MELRTVDLDVVGARAGKLFAEGVALGNWDMVNHWLETTFALLEPAKEEEER